jgi:hypothetical protein
LRLSQGVLAESHAIDLSILKAVNETLELAFPARIGLAVVRVANNAIRCRCSKRGAEVFSPLSRLGTGDRGEDALALSGAPVRNEPLAIVVIANLDLLAEPADGGRVVSTVVHGSAKLGHDVVEHRLLKNDVERVRLYRVVKRPAHRELLRICRQTGQHKRGEARQSEIIGSSLPQRQAAYQNGDKDCELRPSVFPFFARRALAGSRRDTE